jgi:glycosyltransferase involved in cell wall biosynthesis
VQRLPFWEGLRYQFGIELAILKYPGAILRTLRRIHEIRPEIVIVSQPTFTLPIQALVIARLIDAPLIVDLQDIFVQFQEFYPHRGRGRLRLLFEKVVLRKADCIVPVLPAMQELAQRTYGIPAHRFKLLYNGFDSERGDFAPRAWDERDIDLLHLGGPREYYSTESLIDAFEILVGLSPRAELTFTDFVRTPYQERIRSLVDKKALSDRVHFLERQPETTTRAMMTRAKLGVYTLYQRPTSRVIVGTKTFEYLAAGLPIAFLGPESGEMARLIREHGGGFVTSNPSKWAELAHGTLSNRATWEIMSQRALRAAPRYDWKNTIPRLCRERLELLGGKPV